MNTSFPEHLKKILQYSEWFDHPRLSRFCQSFSTILLHDPDLLFRQVVEVVDKAVDTAVGGVDLAPEVGLFVFRPRSGELPVKGEHLLHQSDHPVVALPVRQIGKVDGTDGELLDKAFPI